jgi:inosose dehydratase
MSVPSLGVHVANAPISYGAFELTVGVDPAVPDPVDLLDLVVSAGYAGIDLGPVGYLGDGDELGQRLRERELGLAGGYLELPFSDPDRLAATLPGLDALLDVFDRVPHQPLAPKPTLADAGAPPRRRSIGRSAGDASLGFDDAGWRRFAAGVARVVERCRARDYEPTLHPEAGTHIEAEWEIDRALELTDIGLCLETGHQLVGGGDALATLRRWGDRINHVHVKDASAAIVAGVVQAGEPVEEIWKRRAFCPLGTGDVDVAAILAELRQQGYSGWLVVEQDIMPGPGDPADAHRHQVANRELLRAHGF